MVIREWPSLRKEGGHVSRGMAMTGNTPPEPGDGHHGRGRDTHRRDREPVARQALRSPRAAQPPAPAASGRAMDAPQARRADSAARRASGERENVDAGSANPVVG